MKRTLLFLGMVAVLLLLVAGAQPGPASSDSPAPSGGAGGSASPFNGISVLAVGRNIGTDPPPGQWSDFPADSDGAWSLSVAATSSPSDCYRVKTSTRAGTPMSTLVALVAPPASLLSIWRYDDLTKSFRGGYFADPSQPVDFSSTKGGEEFYVFCVSSAARIGLWAPAAPTVPAAATFPQWTMLDKNAATKDIAADGDKLYQRWGTGEIWQYTGTPCNGTNCAGWQQLDNNPAGAQIAASGGHLYERWGSGGIFQYTGKPCNGTSCTGWTQLDNNAATVGLAAGGDDLYQLHNDGLIWKHNR
jgi:hypothetical protein